MTLKFGAYKHQLEILKTAKNNNQASQLIQNSVSSKRFLNIYPSFFRVLGRWGGGGGRIDAPL